MDLTLSPELLEFREAVHEFGMNEIRPTARERDEKQAWDPSLWRKMGEMGLLGLTLPEEYGGQGANCLTAAVATEAFSWGSADSGLTLSWGAHTIIGCMPIVLCGTEEQKKRLLPALATGERIGGFALTEPGSGSDAAGSMLTTARRVKDRYILNGTKMFITNGPIGDVFIVFAVTDKSRGHMGVSAFIVEKEFPGFRVGRKLDKMGMRTSPTSELIFEDMEVPVENLLSKEHSGFARVGRATLAWERTVLVASSLGMMQFLLEEGVRYGKKRRQFGKPIIRFQAMQDKVASARMKLDASRLLVYRSASKLDRGDDASFEASLGKLHTTEAAQEVAYDMGQIHGGYCFISEYPVERLFRDIRLGTLGAGTSEVLRSIIASRL